MKLKVLFFIFLFSSSDMVAQWIYPELSNLPSDITITYDVVYDRELTQEEKNSNKFMTSKTVVFSKDGKLVENRFYPNSDQKKSTLYNYNKEKFYLCNVFPSGTKAAMVKDFKGPSAQVESQSETKNIIGLKANKATTLVKGRFKDVYYYKYFGLRYSRNINVEGFLLEYPDFNKTLGHYTVIAKTITYKNVNPKIFSLEEFNIFTEEEYEKRMVNVSEKKNNLSLKHVGHKIKKFKAHLINGEEISSKALKNQITLISFCNFKTGESYSKKQIPLLNTLKEKYKTEKINFIAVSINSGYKVNTFLKSNKFSFDVISDGRWLAEKFDISAYPTNIVVGKSGIIKFFETGYYSDLTERLTYEIDKLL